MVFPAPTKSIRFPRLRNFNFSHSKNRFSLCVGLSMCSSSLSLRHQIVSNLVNNTIMSSWFDQKERFDGEQTCARVMAIPSLWALVGSTPERVQFHVPQWTNSSEHWMGAAPVSG